MEKKSLDVESSIPLNGQKPKQDNCDLIQTKINFFSLPKKKVMPSFVKQNKNVSSSNLDKSVTNANSMIDLTLENESSSNGSKQVELLKDLDSDNEEVPLAIIKKRLASSPLKLRTKKLKNKKPHNSREKERFLNNKCGTKLSNVKKISNKEIVVPRKNVKLLMVKKDSIPPVHTSKHTPSTVNTSKHPPSTSIVAAIKGGFISRPVQISPTNVNLAIPAINTSNKLLSFTNSQFLMSPLHSLTPREIAPAPAKSVVIAIDMDPEAWKNLSQEEQKKIMEEKKETARKHLLSLTTCSASKLVSPITPLDPSTKQIVTKFTPRTVINVTTNTANHIFNQQHIMPVVRIDDLELTGLSPLPNPKLVKMPDGLANKMFGDVAMIVEFVNTFNKFLSIEKPQIITAENLMNSLCVDSGKSDLILNIVLLFLKVVLTNDDFKIRGLKIELADLPLTEHTVSYLTEQFLKSQMEKKKKEKKAAELAQAAALAAEKAELGGDLNLSIDEENFFWQSDDDDDEEERRKKKKKKNEIASGSLEYQLKMISIQLESVEFHQLDTHKQLLILTYMLDSIINSEFFSYYYDELEDEKIKIFRDVDTYRKERAKRKQQDDEKQCMATIDQFLKPTMNTEVTEEIQPSVNSIKKPQDSPFSGMTQRQIDAIKSESEKDILKKKELELKKIEAAQQEESKKSEELKEIMTLCRKALRLQSLGMDRYCRTYWIFTKGIPGVYVCSTGVATCSLNLFPPPNVKVERWAHFSEKQEIDLLISSLTIRGVREYKLRNALKLHYNEIIGSLQATPPSNKDDAIKKQEKCSPTEASVKALKEDLVESASRIVHGSLGDLFNLEEWTVKVNNIQDVTEFKQYVLQIQKCILPKFYTSPFDASSNDITSEWCKAVEKAKTLSFLHTLFGILENSIQWDMSAENMRCIVCRRKTGINGQLVRCDECKGGYHSRCLKPPLVTFPPGDWTCPKCLLIAKKKKEELEKEALEYESDHEDLCHVCETDGHMILCDTCPLSYHFECHNPPLRRVPRGTWSCYECRNVTSKDRQNRRKSLMIMKDQDFSDESSSEDGSEDVYKPPYPTKRRYQEKHGNELTNRKRKKKQVEKGVTKTRHSESSWSVKNIISKRKGRYAKESTEEEEEEEKEWADSKTSPILGTKRPRYTKDCLNKIITQFTNKTSSAGESKSACRIDGSIIRTSARKATCSERSQRRAGRSSRGSNYELKACRDIILGLRKNENAWPFLYPVDFDEAQDYLQKVETPMDFSLILKRLDMLEYEDVLQFMEDVKTVFNNSKLYNSDSSDIGQAGIHLAQVFDGLLKEHLPEIYTTFNK